jgi:hypothetical protein
MAETAWRKFASVAAAAMLMLVAPIAWSSLRSEPQIESGWTGKASGACLQCHRGIEPMHSLDRPTDMFVPPDARARGLDRQSLTCVDCHGGDGNLPASGAPTREGAHVRPRNPKIFQTAANPEDTYAALNEESPEFIRFMNPSDFRVAHQTCGRCHGEILSAMLKSIMAHNAMVHNAVFYNNGALETKIPRYGEAFDSQGRPAELRDATPPTAPARAHGALRSLAPHPEFPITRITDPLRVAEVNNPALGTRGPGTDGRIAAVFLNVLKTRLNDPTLWFLGPNRIAGDYRSSGCAACHVVYANDRSPWASAHFARYGNQGRSATSDPTIPKDEPGHPIRHQLELSIPASQCMTCHYHQGDGALGTFLGQIWWDRETEAEGVKKLNAEPEYGGPAYGVESKAQENLADYNPDFQHAQFSDFHAHGWNFMRVYKRDLEGRLLDSFGGQIEENDPDKWKKAVHLRDVHLDKGMQCIDCHTAQDMHGDGNIYPQMTDYIEIRCVDCHGSVNTRVQLGNLETSGHRWSEKRHLNLRNAKTPFPDPANPKLRLPQFYERGGKLIQRSKMTPGLEWQVTQVMDLVDPNSSDYNPLAARAKLVRRDGGVHFGSDRTDVAHSETKMECTTCHSSWQTTCAGCHLPLDLNVKSKDKHYSPQYSRGYAPYYRQVVRVDTFFLGIGTNNHGNKVTPFRPASAVVVSAWDRNRNNIVHQQPLLSAPGFANEAVTPHPPHTVRSRETRQCTDCHLSKTGDNNARVASVLGFGINAFNFMGKYAYVAEKGKGVTAIQVTDGEEPQPVIGSNFHRILHPENYEKFVQRGRALKTYYRRAAPQVVGVTVRGEYLLAAEGPGGVKLYDIANINNKAVAQRIVQAVNSPLGEKTQISSRDATFVHLPFSLPMYVGGDQPVLNRPLSLEEVRKRNAEPPIHALYRYALITDSEEGLILVDIDTLTDGNPENNKLSRAVTFNPDGHFSGARMVKTLGRYAYVVSDRTGLQVVDLDRPLSPRLVYSSPPDVLRGARAIEIQFRYAFVLDQDGLKVFDVTTMEAPRWVRGALVPLKDARNLHVSRTYAYIAAGAQGLVIVNVQKPEEPRVLEYNRSQVPLDDTYDVAVAATNASFFAYVADGRNGLRVLSLVEPPASPGHLGFAPVPTPKLIASYPSAGTTVAVARGQVRDRFVDETGNQAVVSNRIGSRTFNLEEIRRILYYPDGELMLLNNEVDTELLHHRVTAGTKVPRDSSSTNQKAGGG